MSCICHNNGIKNTQYIYILYMYLLKYVKAFSNLFLIKLKINYSSSSHKKSTSLSGLFP